MAKKQTWKPVQVTINAGTMGLSGDDLNAFYQGNICVEELLRREENNVRGIGATRRKRRF